MTNRVRVLPYRLQLVRPIPLATGPLPAREGRLLCRVAADGRIALGDVAPMAGVHATELARVDPLLLALASGRQLAGPIPPALAFGLDVLARDLDGSWPAPRHARVSIAGLFSGTRDQVPSFVDALPAGTESLKVKVGGAPPSDDRALLSALLAALPEHVRLRPDANRRWTLADAEAALAGLPAERVEFLEEPLRNPAELPRLRERTGMPFALDESEAHVEDAVRDASSAWILKWAREGPLTGIEARLAQAADRGRHVVVSSCFESGVGLYAQARLALALNEVPVPCGLGTAAWLAEDVLAPAYPLSPEAVFADDRRPALAAAFSAALDAPGGSL